MASREFHGQIHDDLFHLAGVGADGAEFLIGTKDEFLCLRRSGGARKLAHLFDNGIEIDDLRLEDLQTAEGEQLARERCGAVGGAIDLLDFSRDGVGGR